MLKRTCYLDKDKTAVESSEREMAHRSLLASKDHHTADKDKYAPRPLAIELEVSLSCSKEYLAWLPGESFFL